MLARDPTFLGKLEKAPWLFGEGGEPLSLSPVLNVLPSPILPPVTGFSVGQPEMAPQSEPGEGSHNTQEQMSPPREDSVLGTCSGK